MDEESFCAATENDIDVSRHNALVNAAYSMLRLADIEVTPDVMEQLLLVFLPALEIISSRGYDDQGQTWRYNGWRGQVYEILKRSERLKHHAWLNNNGIGDLPLDIINYCGFLIRADDSPWGGLGEPASTTIDAEAVQRLDQVKRLQDELRKEAAEAEAENPFPEEAARYGSSGPLYPDGVPKPMMPRIPPGSMPTLEDGTPGIE